MANSLCSECGLDLLDCVCNDTGNRCGCGAELVSDEEVEAGICQECY